MSLTEMERAFLNKLATGNWLLRDGKASPAIQSLIDRGYCRESPERLGPLGIYTGEVHIRLSEAGQALLAPK